MHPEYSPAPVPTIPSPAKKKSKLPLILGLITGVMVIMCGAGVACTALVGNEIDKQTGAVKAGASPIGGRTTPGSNATNAAPDTDDTFDQPVGSTITASDNEGSWTLKVSNPVWRTKGCDAYSDKPKRGYFLVVDVEFAVTTGVASINRFDFGFIDSEGVGTDFDVFSGCDEPALDSDNDIRAGGKRKGKVVFDTSGKAGTVEYGPGFDAAEATWKIPAA